VEERDVRYQQERIREVNAGLYCFRAEPLWARLAELTPSRSGELYLTQVIDLTLQSGGRVEGLPTNDPWDAFGINTRRQLAQASDVMRERLCDAWMERGVTIVDPRTTYLDATITLGQDTVLHPGTHLYGDTHVGADCALGPGAILRDTRVADGCVIGGSVLEGAVLEQGVTIGPFCHLRPGAHLKRNVHLGNYVEVKQSTLGEGTAAGHFSYIGDATVGKNVNIGAGAITCNYDGVQKNRTIIGDGAFIGCDTMLVAPVRVGRRAATGAGSVVTRDIPPDTLVVGVPAKPRPRTGKPGNSQG
jgi:bifunctional UDP-N-acetylglucosamine pyrophosphorylase/glucosamine-1-phosphate N-acetyltransferase